jgi:hypothetical protein
MKRILMLTVALLPACTRVVTESVTTEVRPMRYAMLDVTKQLAAPDSAAAYARRALAAQQIKPRAGTPQRVEPGNAQIVTRVVEGGPVHFNAEGELPALDATVTITTMTRGSETRFSIYASGVLPPGVVGGIDPRLMQLVQRISAHIESILAH